MYGGSRRRPYPWDLTLEHPKLDQPVGVLLKLDPQSGAVLVRRQITGLQGVITNSFSYANGSPFARRTQTHARLVMGMGQPVQDGVVSQRYNYALGVDWSCGLGFLAPLFATPFQVGLGPIKDFATFTSGGTTYYAVLSGERVYLSTAGTIDDPSDFVLSRDFSIALATPAAPTVTPAVLPTPGTPGIVVVNGTAGPTVTTWSYQIVAIGAANPPRSAPSVVAGTTGVGTAALNGTDFNNLSWALVPGATNYEVWRTAGGVLGKVGVVAGTSYSDQDSTTVLTAGAPPATALAGNTAYGYKIVADEGGASTESPPTSAASAEGTTAFGPATLGTTLFNHLTWVSTGAAGYKVYRTTGGASPPQLIALLGAVTSYDDDGTNGGGPTETPPALATVQSPLCLAVGGTAPGAQILFVGTDSGRLWSLTAGVWAQTLAEGRALYADSGIFYYATNLKVFSVATYPGGVGAISTVAALDGLYPVTRIIPLNGVVYVLDEQRIYHSTGELTPNRTVPQSADNGRTARRWLNAIYTPFGTGWYRINPDGSIESVGTERLVENTSPIKGSVTAQVGWSSWHQFFAVYDGSTSYLMKYGAWTSPEVAGGANSQLVPVIHGALESWAKKATAFDISTRGEPTGNPRQYIGFGDGYLTYAVLPNSTPYAPGDPNCRFRASGYTVLPNHTMDFQADTKLYQDLTAYGPVLDLHRRVTAQFKLEDSTGWRDLEGVITENGELLPFPEGTSGTWVELLIGLERDAADATLTPVIEGTALHEQLRPAFIEQIDLVAKTGPRLVLNNGHPTRVSGDTLLRQLRDLIAYSDSITATLPDGSRHTVAVTTVTDRLLPGSARAAQQHLVNLTLTKFLPVTPSTA